MIPSITFFRPVVLCLFVLVFTTCSDSNQETDNRTVFNYNEMAGISSLDPASANNTEDIWGVNQVYSGLVQLNDSLTVQPCIAKEWFVSDDGLTYTFKLRNNVYFHDNQCFENGKGRKVTARDFVISFNRLYDARVSSAVSLLANIDRTEKTGYKGFSALNDSTFVVYLKEPFSAFLSVLTMKYFSVIPFEAADFYGQDFRRNPVGTGPFKFKLWEEGTKLVLLKNENYFEFDGKNRLPYLDAVTISFVKDRETAFMELLNGKYDMLSGADAFNINEVLDKNGNLQPIYAEKFNMQKQTFLKTDYLGILVDENIDIVKKSPLRIKALRKAINYGFDRVKMVKFFRNNIGYPATAGFIPNGLPSFNEKVVKGYTYNPEKVRQLLIEAGFPEGKGLPEITLHTTDNYLEQTEFVQSQLADNNIKVNISVDKPVVLRQAVASCEYNLFKKSWVGDYADEENFMSLFYSKNFAPVGSNYTHYKNPDFDILFEKVIREQNREVKNALYQKMDQMLIDDAPIVPLYYDQVIRLVHKNIKDFSTNPMNLLNLKYVKKEAKK
ncbi:MAG: ABC-type dipeptide transport system, periplasmic component [Bacteroidetes bacterium]|jgi:peptide/nickel transport system substrate-binding protein|nr:ABC-type dipeptide transport system, periplasmic component [Bacteroidota bacterium]